MLFVIAAIGYSNAIQCFACIDCDTPLNPVECSDICPTSAACVKFTSSDTGEGKWL